MINVVQLSLHEMKKVGMRPYIYLATILASLASIAMGVEVMNGQTFSMSHIFMFFSMVAEWVIIYYGAKVLGEEFSSRTSTIIFTKTVSRQKIIMSKILSLAGIGLILGAISSVISVVFQQLLTGSITTDFLVHEAFYNMISYVLFALLVGSLGTLVALITMNATSALLITLLSFQFAPALLNMVAEKFSLVKEVLEYIPFYTAITFVEKHQLDPAHLIGIVAGIIIFSLSSIIITNKKDLI